MPEDALKLGFPHWIGITHYINLIFITLLIRSGIQILAQHPRLYFNDHCTPGSEWLKFTKNKVPTDRYWTSLDEAVKVSPWIALPGGRENLGLGRHWHFFSVIFWILNGLTYIILLFFTGNWRRLIPTSWDVFPKAWETFLTYATFHLPPLSNFQPYDPLQQLVYAVVVFVMAPLTILTGAAMSPALAARFPWYPHLFGGRQTARSLHFILLVGYLIFLVIHVSLVIIVDFPLNMGHIVLGSEDRTLAIVLGLFGLLIVFAIHVFATKFSQKHPRKVQVITGALTDKVMSFLFYNLKSHQEYGKEKISPYFWVNGQLPKTEEWQNHVKSSFVDWKLEIIGLVEQPLQLSLADLKAMPKKNQITEHVCIQGWSGFAEWGGVELNTILKMCKPQPEARYLVFHSYQIQDNGIPFYGTLTIQESKHPQTIIAYEMNNKPLPLPHGAPIRLRVETKLGFKMTKWLKSIELVDNIDKVGLGYGGWREDYQYYGTGAEI